MFPRLLQSQTVKAQTKKTITTTDRNRITSPQAASYTFLRGRLAASWMELHAVVGGSSHCNSDSSANAACIQVVLPRASQDHKSGPAPDEQLLLFCPYQFSGDPSCSHYLLALSLCLHPPFQFLLPAQRQQEPSLALPPLGSITRLCLS